LFEITLAQRRMAARLVGLAYRRKTLDWRVLIGEASIPITHPGISTRDFGFRAREA